MFHAFYNDKEMFKIIKLCQILQLFLIIIIQSPHEEITVSMHNSNKRRMVFINPNIC